MYPISEEVKALFDAGHRKVLSITGTDKNGAYIVITDDDVIENSFQIDRYCCNGEKLEIGTAIAAQLDFTLENSDGQYDGIVFEDAELFVAVGIADWTQANPVVNWVPCGYFTSDEQLIKRSTINITALDRMSRFDVVVDGTDLIFPTTVARLVEQSCGACGVTLAQSIRALPNASVSIAELPTVNGTLTYRSLIQWCAGIMATNAWFDWYGQLHFSWYSNMTNYVSDMDNRVTSDMYENDMIVTGVEYTNDAGIPIVEGTDDYDLDLTGNAIAGPLIATVLPAINNQVNGFTYRPFTASAFSAPYLWPMDLVTFTDSEGNAHSSVLTNVAFGLNGATALESKGMTYVRNKAKYPKGFTREQAQLVKEAMTRVEDDIDKSLTQEEIFNRLTDNGAAQGIVLYNGQLYVNASYINTGFLSASRIKGDALTLGGENNVNGTIRVLDGNGNVIGTITKDGIYTAQEIGGIMRSATMDEGELSFKQDDNIIGDIRTEYNSKDGGYLIIDGPVVSGNVRCQMSFSNSGSVGLDANGKAYLNLLDNGTAQLIGSAGVLNLFDNGIVTLEGSAAELGLYDNGTVRLIGSDGQLNLWQGGNVTLQSSDGRLDLLQSGSVRLEGSAAELYLSDSGNVSFYKRAGDALEMLFQVSDGASSKPLPVGSGGTGATDAAGACANLGAVSKSGDTMTGPLTLPWIELNGSPPYIDFHYNGSASDYTSRIIETGSGELSINGVVTIKNGASPSPLPVNNGGTGAINASDARINLQIISGQKVCTFTNNIATYPFSEFGMVNRPSVIIMTPSSDQFLLRYDWDESASNVVLYASSLDGAPVNGLIRFSYIAIP